MTADQQARILSFPHTLPATHPRPDEESDGLWYAYRCHGCRGIVTKVDIIRRRAAKVRSLCDCGSNRISPTNPTARDEQLDFDKLLELAYHIAEGLVTPPPPNDNPEDVARAFNAANGGNDGEETEVPYAGVGQPVAQEAIS